MGRELARHKILIYNLCPSPTLHPIPPLLPFFSSPLLLSSPLPPLFLFSSLPFSSPRLLSHFEEWRELAEACSLGEEEGRGASSELVVEPELEPDAVHLRHSGADVGGLTTAHRVYLLTQWSHGDKDTVLRRGRGKERREEGEGRRGGRREREGEEGGHLKPQT